MIAPSAATGAAKVTLSGGELKISDDSAPLQLTVDVSDATSVVVTNAGGIADPIPPGCIRVGPNQIRCAFMSIGGAIGSVTVKGGDLFDMITTVDHPFFHIRVLSIQTQGGDDTVNIDSAPGQMNTCDLGEGNDICTGGDGETTCNLGAGNDSCTGGASPDSCEMGAGNDVCSTGAERDSCSAGKGRDVCRMGPDPDVCRMGGGPDTCVGGSGRDLCTGNNGEDLAKSCERLRGIERGHMPPSPH
jgi:Ca2+-binding RTX toxin-like protein